MQVRLKKKLPKLHLRGEFNNPAEVKTRDDGTDPGVVSVVWTTGYKGLRQGWEGPYYEELSLEPEHVDMSHLQSGRAKFLAAHDQSNLDAVIGTVPAARIENELGLADVQFSPDEISQRHLQKVRAKVLTDISVGYIVREYTDVSKEGDKYPTYRATKWMPIEISLVPTGFDPGAVVRAEEETENEVEIITRSKSTQMEIQRMDEIEKQRLEQVKLENAKKEAAELGAANERKRASEIRKAVQDAKLDMKLAEEYIERGTSVEDARTNINLFAKYQKEQEETQITNTTRVEVGTDEVDKKRSAIAEATLFRMDGNLFKLEGENEFVGKSLIRNLETVFPRKRLETDVQYATRAMSSSDLPYILANVAEKSAQKKYQIAPVTWNRWAKADTLRNFKTADKVKSGDFSALQERQESGEFVEGSFSEAREQVALKEYGVKMAFTRRMLINDDLSEIAKVMAQAGLAAANLENQLVYQVLSNNAAMADGTELFHADHSNLGTGAAITDSSIGEAIKLMKQQKSLDSRHYLNLSPKYLICGPTEEMAARKYLAQIQPTQASNVNLYSGSLELVVDPNLTANDYFFAADPNQIDTVVLYRLEGEERPRIESRVNFDTENVEIKVAHSAAAKALDHRGMVKNANAT